MMSGEVHISILNMQGLLQIELISPALITPAKAVEDLIKDKQKQKQKLQLMIIIIYQQLISSVCAGAMGFYLTITEN